jgi:hypothetical protein
VTVAGRVLRTEASGRDAFNYSLTRAGVDSLISHDDLANPTELLSVLLLLGHRFGCSNRWDKALVAMDSITMNSYVPDTYRQFGEPLIGGGNNFTYRLGHDVWSVDEYLTMFQRNVAPHIRTAASDLTPEMSLVCGFAACIFSDRVPYLVGTTNW